MPNCSVDINDTEKALIHLMEGIYFANKQVDVKLTVFKMEFGRC